jgi:hypothetical protein
MPLASMTTELMAAARDVANSLAYVLKNSSFSVVYIQWG